MSQAQYTPLTSDSDTNQPSSTHRGSRSAGSSELLLRKVPDDIPAAVWLITVIQACDKAAYYGLAGPMQNYLQNTKGDSLRPGAIGLGQASATAINQAFTVWCFATPILGGVVADSRLGRLKTIIYGSIAYTLGLFIVCTTSFQVFHLAIAAIGLFVAMIFIGIGTGGIRPNVNSLVAEQYSNSTPFRRKLDSGETVLVDPALTMQRIILTYLFCVNAGSLSAVPISTLEHSIGFPAAFALPTFIFALGLGVVLSTKRLYLVSPPRGSVLVHTTRVLWVAAKNSWNLDRAKRSTPNINNVEDQVEWDDDFVDEVRQAMRASMLFIYYPFFWAAYSQMLTNFVSQAGTMVTHGIPNDLLIMMNPLAMMISIPALELAVFPWLRHRGVSLSATVRITWGFALCSIAMGYAAYVQQLVYSSPPCYSFPRAKDCMGGEEPNNVHVLMQLPVYFLLALSEILLTSTGLELAISDAPSSMKSVVMSLFISTHALGSLLAMAITPFIRDPHLILMYGVLCSVTSVTGAVFWKRHYRADVHSD